MPTRRTFAALIDQDSVAVLEYRQEKAGFRVLGSRSETRRFTSPEDAADAVVELLEDMQAQGVSLSVALQHFGSFFHTLIIPPADDDVTRSVILREVQRSFNIVDPAIAYVEGTFTERRLTPRGDGVLPRQVLVAGAPKVVVEAIRARFAKAKILVEGLTVIPEVFRRLYDSLDGSTEATAVLICLANGPHVAFFVNGQLELAIDPPLALDGEAPLDSAVIIDQLERGAIFLRQQSRGTVATRLLLASHDAEYESLASTIEARTGMRVASLGQSIGSPETVVAMGAVLAAREDERLDLYPRAAPLNVRFRSAVTGPAAFVTGLVTAAAIACLWCGVQVLGLERNKRDLTRLQTQVENGVPAVNRMRQSAQGRERIAGIRSTLTQSRLERQATAQLLATISEASPPGVQLDSFTVARGDDGLNTALYGRAVAPSGPAAMSAASDLYRHFQRRSPELRNLTFESAYSPRPAASQAADEDLRFIIRFLAPASGGR